MQHCCISGLSHWNFSTGGAMFVVSIVKYGKGFVSCAPASGAQSAQNNLKINSQKKLLSQISGCVTWLVCASVSESMKTQNLYVIHTCLHWLDGCCL